MITVGDKPYSRNRSAWYSVEHIMHLNFFSPNDISLHGIDLFEGAELGDHDTEHLDGAKHAHINA